MLRRADAAGQGAAGELIRRGEGKKLFRKKLRPPPAPPVGIVGIHLVPEMAFGVFVGQFAFVAKLCTALSFFWKRLRLICSNEGETRSTWRSVA